MLLSQFIKRNFLLSLQYFSIFKVMWFCMTMCITSSSTNAFGNNALDSPLKQKYELNRKAKFFLTIWFTLQIDCTYNLKSMVKDRNSYKCVKCILTKLHKQGIKITGSAPYTWLFYYILTIRFFSETYQIHSKWVYKFIQELSKVLFWDI